MTALCLLQDYPSPYLPLDSQNLERSMEDYGAKLSRLVPLHIRAMMVSYRCILA